MGVTSTSHWAEACSWLSKTVPLSSSIKVGMIQAVPVATPIDVVGKSTERSRHHVRRLADFPVLEAVHPPSKGRLSSRQRG